MAIAGPRRASGVPALPRNGGMLLIAGLVGMLAGAALQSRLGCPATAAGAATVCERRLSQKLDAARVAGKDTALAQQQQKLQAQEDAEEAAEQQDGAAAEHATAAQLAEQQQQAAAAAAATAATAGQAAQDQAADEGHPAAEEQPPVEEHAAAVQTAEHAAAGQAAATQQPAHPEPASGRAEPVPGAAQRGRFVPDGYTLPPECEKHEPLYAGVFELLRPWFARGITRADIDACGPDVAPPNHDFKLGTPQEKFPQNKINSRFRFLSWNNTVYVTSGGLERWDGPGQAPLHYFMLQQLQDAARRFGLPNIEFAVAFADSTFDQFGDAAGLPPALCPLMTFAKHPSWYNLLIPSGEFVRRDFDQFVAKMRLDPGPAWRARDERAGGRWSTFYTHVPHKTRWGGEESDSREKYSAHSNSTGHKYTALYDVLKDGVMPLGEQRKFKYAFNTDGFTASTRFSKLLATGQTVIKQDSELIEWFYPALQPWVHYVPSGWNGIEEIDRVVQYLRDHDQLARRIAGNAQRFAQTHLVSEGRHCYIKVLFEELAKLMKYTPQLHEFPSVISLEADFGEFTLDPGYTFAITEE